MLCKFGMSSKGEGMCCGLVEMLNPKMVWSPRKNGCMIWQEGYICVG